MTQLFDFQPRTRIVYEPGCLKKLGELSRGLKGSRILLVTDSQLVTAGHGGQAERSLEAAGLTVFRFDQVHENPSSRDVLECVNFAREKEINLIVGLGGGSCLDTAKGCNFLLTNGGRMEDYWGYGKAEKAMLPFIAVPTTAGTGSECQTYALISHEQTHQKMACGDTKAAAAVALLDAELTVTQPLMVTVVTALDAITHAVECAVTTRRNPISLLFARESFKLLVRHFSRVIAKPNDVQARAAMQLGAAYAGLAIENSMLGAAHSAANPLTAHYQLVHGQAVATMLPWVVAFNAEDPQALENYKALAVYAELAPASEPAQVVLPRLLQTIDHLVSQARFPKNLHQVGMVESDIPTLAVEAANQWTAQFNPRKLNVTHFEQLYHQALRASYSPDPGSQ